MCGVVGSPGGEQITFAAFGPVGREMKKPWPRVTLTPQTYSLIPGTRPQPSVFAIGGSPCNR